MVLSQDGGTPIDPKIITFKLKPHGNARFQGFSSQAHKVQGAGFRA